MLSLRVERLRAATIPVTTAWQMGACMEARGKQDLWLRTRPEILRVLRQQAIIQSVESSNRIEGVTIPADRLVPLLVQDDRPRDRPEEELAGYSSALKWIFDHYGPIPVTPATLRRLHHMAQAGQTGDAGEWKTRDNSILEFLPNGERRIRFIPPGAAQTPDLVARLCREYAEAIADESVPVLLVIATFVFDLLCIHPFRDGNGRVSRLATTMLLRNAGFEVPRYVSLERMVEDDRDEYYRVLAATSAGWHEGQNDMMPWWNWFLSILRRAYVDMENRVARIESPGGKTEVIRDIVAGMPGPFTHAQIAGQMPAASTQLVTRVLSDMRAQGRLELTGHGRGARWRVVGE